MKYPAATGEAELLNAICNYYNHFYGTHILPENVAVFAGGRPAIYATLAFLQSDITVLVEETEYTPYWDTLRLLEKQYKLIPSNPENNFRPTLNDYQTAAESCEKSFVLKSNPCNPTGVALTSEQLRDMVQFCSQEKHGGLFDEAYEFFADPQESALKYVENINQSNVFVVSAATKGLQAAGLRIGWIVASKHHIELFRNYSSLAMGGVARPSQICATRLLQLDRVDLARKAIASYYGGQRARYGEALSRLGCKLYTGDGGFYHWIELPGNMTCDEFNERLFAYNAAILPGTLCDMFRRGAESPHSRFVRFSFGPLHVESFEHDIEILAACLK